MANQIYDYLTPGDFTYDSDKIEVSGGIAKLKESTDFDGLVGYYKFEDDVLDSSSQGNDGTNYGATFVDGKIGRALSFDGASDYVDLPDVASLELQGDMSIAVWVKSNGTYAKTQSIISNCNSAGSSASYLLMFGSPSNKFVFSSTALLGAIVTNDTPISDTDWHFVVATREGVTGNWDLKIYLDGSPDGSTIGTVTNPGGTYTPAIGSLGEFKGVAWLYGGIVDEPAIYNRVLTPEEIQNMYNTGVGRHLSIYSPDKPTIEPTDLFDPTTVISWDSFLETLGGGNEGSIGYNLYKVDKANKYYWDGGAWVTGGSSSNYNSQATISANIGSFDGSPDKIGFIAYLISDGEQQVELDENQITYTSNQVPLVNAGSNKSCQDNETISPFSDCSFSDPDGTIDHVYYKVDGEVDTWVEIPQGGYGTLLEAVQAWTYQFFNTGVKTIRLQVEDNVAATSEDDLTVTVSQYTVTFNVKDAIGNHVSDFYFVSEDGAVPQLKSSPFTYDYDYIATHYDTVFYKDDYVTNAVEVESIDHTENVILTEPIYEETSRIYHPIRIEVLNFKKSIIKDLVKGDTILFEVKVDADITDWKIRAELWDDGSIDIKKATSNSGGSDFEIEVTDATDGIFIIKIDKGETTNITNEAWLEIEMETNEAKIYTTYQSILKFVTEKIKWETP